MGTWSRTQSIEQTLRLSHKQERCTQHQARRTIEAPFEVTGDLRGPCEEPVRLPGQCDVMFVPCAVSSPQRPPDDAYWNKPIRRHEAYKVIRSTVLCSSTNRLLVAPQAYIVIPVRASLDKLGATRLGSPGTVAKLQYNEKYRVSGAVQ